MNRFGIETNPSCIFRLCFHMNELNGTCTELPAQRHSYVIYREYSSFWQGSNQASWTIGAHFVMSRNRLCVLGPQSWVHIRSTLVPLVCNKKHQSSPPPSLGIPRAPALGEHGIPLPADSVELLAIRPLGGSFARARARTRHVRGGVHRSEDHLAFGEVENKKKDRSNNSKPHQKTFPVNWVGWIWIAVS